MQEPTSERLAAPLQAEVPLQWRTAARSQGEAWDSVHQIVLVLVLVLALVLVLVMVLALALALVLALI